MAWAAGVSRQALTRTFREHVGVTPKLYCMLARFQSSLVVAGSGRNAECARVAAELGYADQSHMIAECRRFSSLTPYQLATSKWFHPFIERAKARKNYGSIAPA
jgi:AraC-like DNA-binding protein